ncbi:hypothetical protein [Sphingomonas sp. CFBP 8760]|uniref:hypothetical protein n=1 Tax=Sphingomonas sp. CFBP 8760 TaxID=2775282 RepID=UPI001A90EF01|nr:hypothetical protein [Sphingomonas sp. CFBP 8760]
MQRIGVGYNTAVANLTNEVTLLNVVRAKEGYPLHYTSVSRLTGNLTMRVNGGFNAQLKQDGISSTDSASTTNAPAGTTTVLTAAQAVAEGGNVYTPSVGGEVSTSPSFDVIVNDGKEFYQGISSSISPETLGMLIEQAFEPREVLSVAIARVDFRLKSASPHYAGKAGSLVETINNDGTRDDTSLNTLFNCYAFSTEKQKTEGTILAPVSRVTQDDRGGRRLSMQDLALLDGAKLDLKGALGADPEDDVKVTIVRPGASSTVGRFTPVDPDKSLSCPLVAQRFDDHGRSMTVRLPATPPPGRVFAGDGKMLVAASDSPKGQAVLTLVDVDILMTIRSPDAVVRFVGECLRKSVPGTVTTCAVGGSTVFELHAGAGAEGDVSATLNGRRYHIAKDTPGGLISLRTLSLIERLINLHKSSTDKAVTQAVRVIS